MLDALRMVAALRSALFTRLDVLVEILALRHQLGVLARSDRRFRPSDRLFWMCLRRVWPRWQEALVLVQPATVARWHRRGFPGWWSGPSRRRPHRPRIDSDVRDLIRHMSTENRLWGAPRIHGELLKLGIAVSERTVSRYLPDRTTGRSQTWRTFLTNHFGALSGNLALGSSERPGDDDVVDTSLLARRLTSTSGLAERLQPTQRLPLALLRLNPSLLAHGVLEPDLHRRARARPVPAAIHRGPLRLAKRVRTQIPSSGCALQPRSTDSLRRIVRDTSRIATGQFGHSPCAAASIINAVTRLTRLGCAHSERP
jgi:hypothetical protein